MDAIFRRAFIVPLFALAATLVPHSAFAALIYLNPKAGTYQPGDTIPVEVRIDTQGECVNAADINIGYPKNILDVVDVSRGESIFPIWIQAPVAKKQFGFVAMVGGIPGGYCGRTPGDPALTNMIVKIIFRVLDKPPTLPTTAKVSVLGTSRVVLNDGLGTESGLVSSGAEFIVAQTGKAQPNVWTESLKNDKTPPESFVIEVNRDKTVFDNKYFAVFSTVDKQTGLDRYLVSETRDASQNDASKTLSWKSAESPYVLEDQQLRSVIRVKAIDKAGNERIDSFKPSGTDVKKDGKFILWLVGSATLLFVLIRFIRFLPL